MVADKIKFYAKRENGNILKGDNLIAFKNRWVVRDEGGNYIDHSAWSNDLRVKFDTKNSELIFINFDDDKAMG